MVYYFGLVVSENANAIGYAYGEYGQFGYKVDAQRGAAALRHKKRYATGRREHQQLPWCKFRQHLPKPPTAAFPDPPKAPEALPTRPR